MWLFLFWFCKVVNGCLETQGSEWYTRSDSEAPVDDLDLTRSVFLGRLRLHCLLLVFHELCERFAVHWLDLFALLFAVLQRLPQSWVGLGDWADRDHHGHLGDRGDDGLLGLCALRLTLLEHSGEFRGIHVYGWITIVFYMQFSCVCLRVASVNPITSHSVFRDGLMVSSFQTQVLSTSLCCTYLYLTRCIFQSDVPVLRYSQGV